MAEETQKEITLDKTSEQIELDKQTVAIGRQLIELGKPLIQSSQDRAALASLAESLEDILDDLECFINPEAPAGF